VITLGPSSQSVWKWYWEDESAKGAGKICKSGTYLWAVVEQVHKGRSTRSAIKKETTLTTASRQCSISKKGIQQVPRRFFTVPSTEGVC